MYTVNWHDMRLTIIYLLNENDKLQGVKNENYYTGRNGGRKHVSHTHMHAVVAHLVVVTKTLLTLWP